MRRFFRVMAIITCLLAAFGSYSLVTMILDRTPPITYQRADSIASTVPQGGSIDVEFEVNRERICPSTVKRWLVDSAGTRHSITNFTVGSNLKRGKEVYQRAITVPETATIGPAYYEVKLEFACNIIQRLGWPVRLDAPHIKFEIIPSVSLTPFKPPDFQDFD